MRSRTYLPVALLLGIAMGVVASPFFIDGSSVAQLLSRDDDCDRQYSLINPWLRCEPESNLQKKKEFTDFKAGLEKKIAGWTADGKVTNVSVYLRDLQFGPWMGIGEQEEFSAASLLKVPVMLAVLKQAETHPEILGQRVEVTKELAENFEQEFKPSHHVEVDGIYTVDELLQYMIVNSDNNAKTALDAFLQIYKPDDVLLMNTMDDLGFTGVYRSLNDALTVKQVASLFRLLYNSSYLNKQMSQKALDLLLASEFRSGIVAGVPPGIPVAHKFGEREEDTGVKQLHDCGIVYHPRDHYLLCIMTLGKDEQKLASVIADISRLIYAEIDDRSVQQ